MNKTIMPCSYKKLQGIFLFVIIKETPLMSAGIAPYNLRLHLLIRIVGADAHIGPQTSKVYPNRRDGRFGRSVIPCNVH